MTDMDRIESIFVIKPSLRVNLSYLSLVKGHKITGKKKILKMATLQLFN